MIRTAIGLVLAVVFAAVAGYYALAWWAFRVTGHPDPYAEPFFDDGSRC